jgi:hypothetical protein
VDFQFSCPEGYVVGGIDAELTSRTTDLTFAGRLGSPVNPGITTSRAVVFSALEAGHPEAPSFKPHLGCIPSRGGGSRIPTSVTSVFPPGEPTAVLAVDRRLGRAGMHRFSLRCPAGTSLVGASHAVAFTTDQPPTAPRIAAVEVSRKIVSGRVIATVTVGRAASGISSLQLAARCTRGSR